MMLNDTIMMKTDELQKLQNKVQSSGKSTDDTMRKVWEKRSVLDEELSKLRYESETLNYNRNNMYSEISNSERILKEKQDDLARLSAKKNVLKKEVDE